jgi:hypothetical protein
MSIIIKAIESTRESDGNVCKQLLEDWDMKKDLYNFMAQNKDVAEIKSEIQDKYSLTVDVQNAYDEINKQDVKSSDELLTKRMFLAERLTDFMNDKIDLSPIDISMINKYIPELNGQDNVTKDILKEIKDNNLNIDAFENRDSSMSDLSNKAVNAMSGLFAGGIAMFGFAAATSSSTAAVIAGLSFALGYFATLELVKTSNDNEIDKKAQNDLSGHLDSINHKDIALSMKEIKSESVNNEEMKNSVKKIKR